MKSIPCQASNNSEATLRYQPQKIEMRRGDTLAGDETPSSEMRFT